MRKRDCQPLVSPVDSLAELHQWLSGLTNDFDVLRLKLAPNSAVGI